MQRYHEMRMFEDSVNRPYLHLVDGGVSDNLGMRAVLESLESAEARRGRLRYLAGVNRIVVDRGELAFAAGHRLGQAASGRPATSRS